VAVCHLPLPLRTPSATFRAERDQLRSRHYRLADVTDPLVLTIRQAVTHALGHVDAIHRDAQRMEKKTACCVVPAGAPPENACCGRETAV
jgi:hypothetical protein